MPLIIFTFIMTAIGAAVGAGINFLISSATTPGWWIGAIIGFILALVAICGGGGGLMIIGLDGDCD